MTDLFPTRFGLSSGGVGVVLECDGGRLPAVVHWGADIGDADDLAALVEAGTRTQKEARTDFEPRLAILPEHWTGWMGLPGLTGSRGGEDWSPRFSVRRVLVDGAPASSTDDVRREGATALVFEARDDDALLDLAIEVELDAVGLLRVRAAVTNAGERPYRVDGIAVALPVPRVAREVLDLAGRWSKERMPQRRPLGVERYVREQRRGVTGLDSATVLHLGVPGFDFATGEVWAVHTGWSGNHLHYAERLSTGEQVIGGGEVLLPGEIELGPGESYSSPWVYGNYGVGLDDVAARFHRHLRARPQHPSTPRPVTLNVWEAVYFDHRLDGLLDLAEKAAALGVERYVLDDGWFGGRRSDHAGLGDWVVAKDVWPDGLHPLVDRVRELGMQFGLWVEPEMVNLDSDLARAHPEWIMATDHRLPLEERHQQVLNIGIEECFVAVRDMLFAILDEYDIVYLKWDHNRQLLDAGTQPSGRPGVHAQTLAFYRLVDALKQRYPGLEIESCSSGGGRIDLGVLERTDRVWVSDCIDPHERQLMHRWTGQLLPPELMGAHVASGRSHTTGRLHDLSFRAATAVFNHFGIEWDLRRATDEELHELGIWIDFHKRNRELLHSGGIVRMDNPDDGLVLHGVVAADRSAAIYSHAVLERSIEIGPGAIRLPGLDPARRYRVRPVPLEGLPEGVVAPRWWGLGQPRTFAESHGSPTRPVQVRSEIGVVASGAALARLGLAAALLPVDHAVIYLAEAEPAGR